MTASGRACLKGLRASTHGKAQAKSDMDWYPPWRPTRPIARGGQAPTIEPSFQVPPGPVPKSMTISHMLPIIPRFMYAREFETQAAIDDDANEPSSPSPSRSSGEQSASKHASDESTLDEDSYSSSEEDSPHKAPQPRHPPGPGDSNRRQWTLGGSTSGPSDLRHSLAHRLWDSHGGRRGHNA